MCLKHAFIIIAGTQKHRYFSKIVSFYTAKIVQTFIWALLYQMSHANGIVFVVVHTLMALQFAFVHKLFATHLTRQRCAIV